MKSNSQIKFAVSLTVVLLVGALYLQGQSIIKPSVHALSWITTIVVSALFVWNKWLWACKPFYRLSKMPDVRGTWKAELNSLWKNPATGQIRGKIEVYLVFRQTLSNLDMRLFSVESSSVSLSASIVTDGEGVHTIAATYRNEPSPEHLSHSPMSHGAALLNVRGESVVAQIDGKYWTDRNSMGALVMTERSREVATSFDNARLLFQRGGR